MTHLATADTDPAFAARQLERFREGGDGGLRGGLTRHAANSAATLRLPASRLDAVRCGVALYGLSPFGGDPAADGLRPVLRWTSVLAQVKRLEPGEHRLRAALRGSAADVDRARPGRVRGRVSAGHDGNGGAGRRRAAARRGHGVDGRGRRRAGPRAAAGDAGDAGRRRHPRGAPRARRRHDQLRDRLRDRSAPTRAGASSSMVDALREALRGRGGVVVGGAVRDGCWAVLVDLDVACRAPREAAREYAAGAAGAVPALSERHGAWRVARRDGRTVDFHAAAGRDRDRPAHARLHRERDRRAGRGRAAGRPVRRPRRPSRRAPADGHAHGLRRRPTAALRAVAWRTSSASALDPESERLVRDHAQLVARPTGERILAELRRLTPRGLRRLDELGLLAPLGGSLERACPRRRRRFDGPSPRRRARLGARAPCPSRTSLRRRARTLLQARRPPDDSPALIHRFRRATEPWALGARPRWTPGLREAVERARAQDPPAPLLRGDELGLPEGPEIGRLLDRLAEERAAGTVTTREEAPAWVRKEVARGAR